MSEAAPREGFPVVLTADRTLMARYRLLFDGMVSSSQTTTTPEAVMRLLLAPKLNGGAVRAPRAPLGLRRVEAALLQGGFGRDEVAVVPPEELGRAVGPRTRVVGVSSGDPLGIGMNSSTMTALEGGEIYCGAYFRRLAEDIAKLRCGDGGPRVVMGGPGAWQLATDDAARRRLGVDHVVSGYCEGDISRIFSRIAEGSEEPPLLECSGVPAEKVPAIRGPSVMGVVEISRGCGLGCRFCTLAREPMMHFAADAVIRDAETNLAAGVTNISLISEDFFRYGSKGPRSSEPGELTRLLRELRGLDGLRLMQIDHANITSASRFDESQLAEIRELLAGGDGWVWVNMGVETAAGELLEANGGAAKMRPFGADDWADACRNEILRLSRAGFLPVVSLVVGMPGETEEDLRRTIRWVEGLADERVSVTPVLYAAVDGSGEHFTAEMMKPLHWRLFEVSYRLNFRWMPRLLWESSTEAGRPLWKRAILGLLGRGRVALLRRRLTRLSSGPER